jgi:hypothetical protein
VPAPPANVTASASSLTTVLLNWTASAGATGTTQYEIARASAGSAFAIIGTTAGTTFNDTVTAGNAYVYKVRASDTPGKSAYSLPDVATTITFTDDPLVAQLTRIKAVHLAELRQAVNAVRAAAGLTATTFTDPTASPGTTIRAVHFQELRTALNQARAPLGLSNVTFTDAALNAGTTSVRSAHITDLRNGVK